MIEELTLIFNAINAVAAVAALFLVQKVIFTRDPASSWLNLSPFIIWPIIEAIFGTMVGGIASALMGVFVGIVLALIFFLIIFLAPELGKYGRGLSTLSLTVVGFIVLMVGVNNWVTASLVTVCLGIMIGFLSAFIGLVIDRLTVDYYL